MDQQFFVQGDKLYPRFNMGIYQINEQNTDIMTSELENCDETYEIYDNIDNESNNQDPTNDVEIPNLEELIKLVVNQTACSETAAKRALILCEGDVICAILRVTD